MITTLRDGTNRVRVHVVRGELTIDELYNWLEAAFGAPEFRPDQVSLWDLREAHLADFTTDDVRRAADLVQRHWGTMSESKAALVVKRDVDFGLARMFEMHVTDESLGKVRVFRRFEQAMAWLYQEPCP